MTFTIELDEQDLKQLEHSAVIKIFDYQYGKGIQQPSDLLLININKQVIKQLRAEMTPRNQINEIL